MKYSYDKDSLGKYIPDDEPFAGVDEWSGISKQEATPAKVLMSQPQYEDILEWSKWETAPHSKEESAQEYSPLNLEEDAKFLELIKEAQIKYSMGTAMPADTWQAQVKAVVNPPASTWTITSTNTTGGISYWASTPQYVGQYPQKEYKEYGTPFFNGLPSQNEEQFAREAMIAEEKEKIKRIRYPSYKKDDRVQTPEGPGSVWSVDRDGTVCVELDKDSTVLYEFEKKELKKIKTKG